MGGTVIAFVPELVQRFKEHGGVALHDPCGDIFIAGPRGILYQEPAVFLRQLCRIAHGIVIRQVGDGDIGIADLPDGLRPDLYGASRHEHMGAAAQHSRSPRDTPSVVSVRGGDELHAGDPVPIFRGLQRVHGGDAVIQPQLPAHHPEQSVQPAQRLKGVEAEARGLVFHQHGADTAPFGKTG